jgi:hypothetical protein
MPPIGLIVASARSSLRILRPLAQVVMPVRHGPDQRVIDIRHLVSLTRLRDIQPRQDRADALRHGFLWPVARLSGFEGCGYRKYL